MSRAVFLDARERLARVRRLDLEPWDDPDDGVVYVPRGWLTYKEL